MTTDPHLQARAYVQARLDDRLPPPDQAWLAAHLAGCDACRRYAAELSSLERLLPETFQARWDAVQPARSRRDRVAGLADSNRRAPVALGGPTMVRQKVLNYAGITAGLGALVVLLAGFALALQVANTSDSRTPGQVVVESEPLFEQPPHQVASPVSFGDSIRLEGYTVFPGNGFITVELIWHALAAPPRDYMVGVFVMPDGAQSAIPARSDAVPGGGLRPTSGWQAGEYVLDSHQLAIASDTDEAALDNLVLWVNVYNPETGDRLPSDPPGGGPFNAVSIGMLVRPAPQPTATPLPVPTDATPAPCLGECTPTPTPCQVGCSPDADATAAMAATLHSTATPLGADATAAMAATLGWTATPLVFEPSATPCQSFCPMGFGSITLESYTVTPASGGVTVELVWRVAAVPPADYAVGLKLRGAGWAIVAQSDELPALSRHLTSGWQPGQHLVDTHTLVLPADLPAGPYLLEVDVFDLQYAEAPVMATGEGVPLGQIELPLTAPTPAPLILTPCQAGCPEPSATPQP